jgi:hypothetical protein
MHTAALIASTNESLIAANTKLTRKQAKKQSYIASRGYSYWAGRGSASKGEECSEAKEEAK